MWFTKADSVPRRIWDKTQWVALERPQHRMCLLARWDKREAKKRAKVGL
jgi:hypothetical protein